jgi:hypothetical protein
VRLDYGGGVSLGLTDFIAVFCWVCGGGYTQTAAFQTGSYGFERIQLDQLDVSIGLLLFSSLYNTIKWVYPIFKHTRFTLWLFNIAVENGPFIDGLPIKNGDFPWLC